MSNSDLIFLLDDWYNSDKCYKDSLRYSQNNGDNFNKVSNHKIINVSNDYDNFPKIMDLNKNQRKLLKDDIYQKIKKNLIKIAKNSKINVNQFHLNSFNYVNSMLSSNPSFIFSFNFNEFKIDSLDKGFTLDQIPGNNPENWPEKLDIFLNEIKEKHFLDMFLQPLLIYDNFLLKSKNKLNEFMSNKDYENYFKVISIILIWSILSSEMSLFIEMTNEIINFEEKFNSIEEELQIKIIKNIQIYLLPIFSDYFLNSLLAEKMPNINDKNPSTYFKTHLNIDSKFTNNYCFTTDGNYVYLYICNPNIIMYKIGTGNNLTNKGEIYLKKSFKDKGEVSSWVYLKNKLYLRNNINAFGTLDVYCPSTFDILGQIQLNIKQFSTNNIISMKNKNFQLLTDGSHLYTILINIDFDNKLDKTYENEENVDNPKNEDNNDDENNDLNKKNLDDINKINNNMININNHLINANNNIINANNNIMGNNSMMRSNMMGNNMMGNNMMRNNIMGNNNMMGNNGMIRNNMMGNNGGMMGNSMMKNNNGMMGNNNNNNIAMAGNNNNMGNNNIMMNSMMSNIMNNNNNTINFNNNNTNNTKEINDKIKQQMEELKIIEQMELERLENEEYMRIKHEELNRIKKKEEEDEFKKQDKEDEEEYFEDDDEVEEEEAEENSNNKEKKKKEDLIIDKKKDMYRGGYRNRSFINNQNYSNFINISNKNPPKENFAGSIKEKLLNKISTNKKKDTYETINFYLLKFDIEDKSLRSNEELVNKYKDNILIKELYGSFDGFYSFEKCIWAFNSSCENINEAALHLIREENKNHKEVNILSETLLYQAEVVNDIPKSNYLKSISLYDKSLLFFDNIFDTQWFINNKFVYNSKGHIFLKDPKQKHLLNMVAKNYKDPEILRNDIKEKEVTENLISKEKEMIQKIIKNMNFEFENFDKNDYFFEKFKKIKDKLKMDKSPISLVRSNSKNKKFYGTYITTNEHFLRINFQDKKCVYDNINDNYTWILPNRYINSCINQIFIGITKPSCNYDKINKVLGDSKFKFEKRFFLKNNKKLNIDFTKSDSLELYKDDIDLYKSEFLKNININNISDLVDLINELLMEYTKNSFNIPKRLNNWIYMYQLFVQKGNKLKKKKYKKIYDKITKIYYNKYYINKPLISKINMKGEANFHELYYLSLLNLDGSNYTLDMLLNYYKKNKKNENFLRLIYLWSISYETNLSMDSLNILDEIIWYNINNDTSNIRNLSMEILYEVIELLIYNKNLFIKYFNFLFNNLSCSDNKINLIFTDISNFHIKYNDSDFNLLITKILKKLLEKDILNETFYNNHFNVKFEYKKNDYVEYSKTYFESKNIFKKYWIQGFFDEEKYYLEFINLVTKNYTKSVLHSYFIWNLIYKLLIVYFKHLLSLNNKKMKNMTFKIIHEFMFLLKNYFNYINKENQLIKYQKIINEPLKTLLFLSDRFLSPFINRNYKNLNIINLTIDLISILKKQFFDYINIINTKKENILFNKFWFKNKFEGINFANSIEINSNHPLERGKTYHFENIYFKGALGISIEFDKKCDFEENKDILTIESWYKNYKKSGSLISNNFNDTLYYGTNFTVYKIKNLEKNIFMVGDNITIYMKISPIVKKISALLRWGYRLTLRPVYSFDYLPEIKKFANYYKLNNINTKLMNSYLISLDKLTMSSLFNLEPFLKGKTIKIKKNDNYLNQNEDILKWKIFRNGLLNNKYTDFNENLTNSLICINKEEKLKESNDENSYSKINIFYKNIENFSYVTETLLDKVNSVEKENKLENLKYDTDINNIISFIKNLNNYPYNYLAEKKRSNFKPELQKNWEETENYIIITMLHHLNIIELVNKNNKNIVDHLINSHLLKNIFIHTKKKFNEILTTMILNLQIEKEYQQIVTDIIEIIKVNIIEEKNNIKLEKDLKNKEEIKEIITPKENKTAKEKILEKLKNKKNKKKRKKNDKKSEKSKPIEIKPKNLEEYNITLSENEIIENILNDKFEKNIMDLLRNYFENDNEKLENFMIYKNIIIIKNDHKQNLQNLFNKLKIEISKLKIQVKEDFELEILLKNYYLSISEDINNKCNFLLKLIPSCYENNNFIELNFNNNDNVSIKEDKAALKPLGVKRTFTGDKKKTIKVDYSNIFKKIKENNLLKDENPKSENCNAISLVYKFLTNNNQINPMEINKKLNQSCKNSTLRVLGFKKVNEIISIIKNTWLENYLNGIFNNSFESWFEGIQNTSFEFKELIINESNKCFYNLVDIINTNMCMFKKNKIENIFKVKNLLKKGKMYNKFENLSLKTLNNNLNILNEVRCLLTYNDSSNINICNKVELFISNLLEFYLLFIIEDFLSDIYCNFIKIWNNSKNTINLILNIFLNENNSSKLMEIIIKLIQKEIGFVYNDERKINENLLLRMQDPYNLERILFLLNLINEIIDYINSNSIKRKLFYILNILLEYNNIQPILCKNINKLLLKIHTKIDYTSLNYEIVTENNSENKKIDFNIKYLNNTVENNFYLNYIRNIGEKLYQKNTKNLAENEKYVMLIHLNEEENLSYLILIYYYLDLINKNSKNNPKNWDEYKKLFKKQTIDPVNTSKFKGHSYNMHQIIINEDIINNIPEKHNFKNLDEENLPIGWYFKINSKLNQESSPSINPNLKFKVNKVWSKASLDVIKNLLDATMKELKEPKEESTQEEKDLFIKNFVVLNRLQNSLKKIKIIYNSLNFFNFFTISNKGYTGFNYEEICKVTYIFNLGINNMLEPLSLDSFPDSLKNVLCKLVFFQKNIPEIKTKLTITINSFDAVKKYHNSINYYNNLNLDKVNFAIYSNKITQYMSYSESKESLCMKINNSYEFLKQDIEYKNNNEELLIVFNSLIDNYHNLNIEEKKLFMGFVGLYYKRDKNYQLFDKVYLKNSKYEYIILENPFLNGKNEYKLAHLEHKNIIIQNISGKKFFEKNKILNLGDYDILKLLDLSYDIFCLIFEKNKFSKGYDKLNELYILQSLMNIINQNNKKIDLNHKFFDIIDKYNLKSKGFDKNTIISKTFLSHLETKIYYENYANNNFIPIKFEKPLETFDFEKKEKKKNSLKIIDLKKVQNNNDFVFPPTCYISDLPKNQQKRKNFKMLKYWEKYIFPRIQAFVTSFFSAYENDEFFEKMRIELRSNKLLETAEIAYIICEDKLPSNCEIPDFNYDWNSYSEYELKIGLKVIINYSYLIENKIFSYHFNNYKKIKIDRISGQIILIDSMKKVALVEVKNPINNNNFSVFIPFNYLYPIESKIDNNINCFPYNDLEFNSMLLYQSSILKIKNDIMINNLTYDKSFNLYKCFDVINNEISTNLSNKYPIDGWNKYLKKYNTVNKEKINFENFEDLLKDVNKNQNKPKIRKNKFESIENFIYNLLNDINNNQNFIDILKNKISDMNNFFMKNNYTYNLKDGLNPDQDKSYKKSNSNVYPLNIFSIRNNNIDIKDEIKSILIIFKQEAFLSMCSGISFFKDSEGINLIENIENDKNSKKYLNPVLLNSNEIYFSYYYNKEGIPLTILGNQKQSDLPCGIYAIPNSWNTNMWLIEIISYYIYNRLKTEKDKNIIENFINIYIQIIAILLDLFNNFNGPNICSQNIIKLISLTIFRFKNILNYCKDYIKNKYNSKELLDGFIKNAISLDLFNFKKYFVEIKNLFKKEEDDELKIYSSYLQDYIEMIGLYIKTINLDSYEFKLNITFEDEWISNISNFYTILLNLTKNEKENNYIKEHLKKEINIENYNRFIFSISNLENLPLEGVTEIFLEKINCHKFRLLNKDLDLYLPFDDDKNLIGNGCLLLDGLTHLDHNFITNICNEMNEKKEVVEVEKFWNCEVCTFLNSISTGVCQICESPKPNNVKEVDQNGIEIVEENKEDLLEDEFSIENRIKIFIFDLKRSIKSKFEKNISIKNNDLNSDEFIEFLVVRNSSEEFSNLISKAKSSIYKNSTDYIKDKNLKLNNEDELIEYIFSNEPLDVIKILGELGYDYWLQHSLLSYNYSNYNSMKHTDLLLIKEIVDDEICKKENFTSNFEPIFLRNSIDYLCSENLINYPELYLQNIKYNRFKNSNIIDLRIIYSKIKLFNQLFNNNFSLLNLKKEINNEKFGFSDYLDKVKNLIFHKNINSVINKIMKKTSISIDKNPEISLDRLKIKSKDKNKETIEDTYFYKAYLQIKNIPTYLLRPQKPSGADPFIPFVIKFKNENVQGTPGPCRQFFTDISNELQPSIINSNSKFENSQIIDLLCPTSNKLNSLGDNKEKFTINPSKNSTLDYKLFYYLGILMGCSFRTGIYLTINLPSIFWKKFTKEPITEEDIKEFDKSLPDVFKYFTEYDEVTFNEYINQTYTTVLSNNKIKELIENGENIHITFKNRFDYLKKLLLARITESDEQIETIKKGFSKLIPLSILRCLTAKDLEIKICGINKIDLELLKRHTVYSGEYSENHQFIKDFWDIIHNLKEKEKIRFIKFCWGQERLPPTDLDFEITQTRFLISIQKYPSNNDKYLLVADTCFFNLKIPDYSSKEIMKKQVLISIYIDIDSLNADNPLNNNEVLHHPNAVVNENYDRDEISAEEDYDKDEEEDDEDEEYDEDEEN